jgi:uncharacterized membrane protein YgaE (UPF0421/DUF939 family)
MVLRFVVDVHTTCFGLHGHLQVCVIFSFVVLKESASLFLLPLLHVVILCSFSFVFVFVAFPLISILKNTPKATKAAKQIPSGLKSKISYTPEDGHIGRNMYCEQ